MEEIVITKEMLGEVVTELMEKLSTSKARMYGGGDLTIAQVQRILGCGRSAAYDNRYHGEYRHNGRRMVQREEFMYRRSQGLDVCITK